MRDDYKLAFLIVLAYIIAIIGFIVAAIMLNKWWLLLLSVLVCSGLKINNIDK